MHQQLNLPTAKLELYPESRELLILFSSRNHHTYEFVGTFRNLKINKLFLVDSTGDAWYQCGVVGVADNLTGLAEKISAICDINNIKRVICIGASMGAFAAISVGAMISADSVIACSPQTRLNPGWDLTPPIEIPIYINDLKPLVKNALQTKFIITSSSTMLDTYHASQLAGLANVQTYIIPGPHNILSKLKENNALDDFFSAMLTEKNLHEIGIFTEPLNLSTLSPYLGMHLDHFYAKRYKEALTPMRRILLAQPNWVEALLQAATCHYMIRDFNSALPLLIKAYNINCTELSIYPKLIGILAKKGFLDRCEQLLLEFVTLTEASGRTADHALQQTAKSTFHTRANDFSVQLRLRLITKHDDESANNLYQLARTLQNAKKYDEAIKYYSEVIKRRTSLSEKELWMYDRSAENIQSLQQLPSIKTSSHTSDPE